MERGRMETMAASATGPWPFSALGLAAPGARPRVAVLGLARSGLAAARLLQSRGLLPDLLDLRLPEDPDSAELCRQLVGKGARLRLGAHDPAWLGEIDLIVKSPGVPGTIPFLVEAGRRGVPVIGELELGGLAARGPILAITGTNGKSTTTAWAGDILRCAGKNVQVVGNIGRALCQGVCEDPEALFVTEVSSFQLEDVRTFHARVAVILNLTPDHQDRHGTLEAYREAKFRLLDLQGEKDLALLGPDAALASAARPRVRGRWGRFAPTDLGEEGAALVRGMICLRREGQETPLLPPSSLSLPGPHNLENALAAAAAAAELGAPAEAIIESLRSFRGLPHRLEPVATIRGVAFVNDSKATNTDSLEVALRSFDRPVLLIAGGRDKGQDFRPLRPLIRERVARLLLIGEAQEKMEQAWPETPATRAASLEEAVALAARLGQPGETVLLSPACASFDMFKNYEERGDLFRRYVRRLEGNPSRG
jgi:UDP-N-acetylmuramoylalanine--D-glutamate ligase